VGVSPSAALFTAVSVGILSLGVLVLVAAMVAFSSVKTRQGPVENPDSIIDYTRLVSLGLPLAAATLIFFQLHIPTTTGLVTANLADPVAILGGGLFLIVCFSYRHQWPTWRLPGLNSHLLAATGVIVSSLLLGAYRFGWTDWALFNKSLGWLVLLAYVGTGALMVYTAGYVGLRQLLFTFVAAAAAIVILHLVLVTIRQAGVHLPPTLLGYNMEGFAENRNAFAFQLVMVMAAAFALVAARENVCTIILALALTGLWYAGSRAGWLTLPFLFVAALYLRAISARRIAFAIGLAIAIIGVITVVPFLTSGAGSAWKEMAKTLTLYDESSTSERIKSLQGGLSLFLRYPIFGAGLGAYMESVLREDGTPLVIHSTPLWLLAETGIVGFLIFATPILRIFWSETRKPSHDLASKLLVLIIVAFAVMSSVHEMLYQRSFWLLLGAALAYLPNLPDSSSSNAYERSPVDEFAGG
jgi:O-antigen ligase